MDDDQQGRPSIQLSVLDDVILSFEVKSLLGHRTKIKDLPKVTTLIVSRIRALFFDLFVASSVSVPLPLPL